MTRLASALALVATAGALAACGGDEESEPGGQRAAEPTATAESNRSAGAPVVEMTDALKFEPQEITVSVGDRVEWRNVGNIAHTVTTDTSKVADPGGVSVPDGVEPWDSGLLAGDGTFTRFKRPGTYEYVCIPHEGARMVGTVIVEGP